MQALDLVASLRAKGTDGVVVTQELARLARELGINPRTADKRTRPARKAWMVEASPIVARAAELFPGASKADQLALHAAVLFTAYPFFYDTLEQIGTAQRLGAVVRQATVRDRLMRRYGHGANVQQGVQKVFQTLVSWGLLQKTAEAGVYHVQAPQPISGTVAEVLVAAILVASGREALPVSGLGNHPAAFPFEIPGWGSWDSAILRQFTEGSGGLFVQLGYE